MTKKVRHDFKKVKIYRCFLSTDFFILLSEKAMWAGPYT